MVVPGVHADLADRAQQGHGESAAGVDVAGEHVDEPRPPSSPGSHAITSAAAWGTTSVRECARPPITTTTVGTPEAAVASMRASCSGGSRRSLASRNSPGGVFLATCRSGRRRRRPRRRRRRTSSTTSYRSASASRGVGTRQRDPAEVRRCDHLLDDLVGADVDGAAGVGVVAVEAARVGGRRAEHRDARSRRERQRPVVGQQHDRPGRGPTGQGEIVGGLDAPRRRGVRRSASSNNPSATFSSRTRRHARSTTASSSRPDRTWSGERGVVDAGREARRRCPADNAILAASSRSAAMWWRPSRSSIE